MKYTGPKFKLCRREQKNLFGSTKYDIKKRRSLPGQSGAGITRYSDYGKLLRNKQSLKRTYFLSEKQFANIVKKKSLQYAKNNNISHDQVLFQFLETRMDMIVFRSGLANSIIQARQMVNHGHFYLNNKKHNIPSTHLKPGDTITLKQKLHSSPLYSQSRSQNNIIPSRIKVDKNNYTIQLLHYPKIGEIDVGSDILKVIEFYARA